ncbi:hypothetical protein KP509_02G078900 [Ceratopteris richardii]|uniref:dual-specificity kinase n=2 Tax=Ceratopteris richardii TaxID=49495 RepID=A0A8T2V7N9_CERRI|nr:hypothetical protein KP509_02G078900 [Ceratopteris richardii]
MAALDFLSQPFSVDGRPNKRPRFHLNDIGDSLLADSTFLQLQLSSRLLCSDQSAACSGEGAQCALDLTGDRNKSLGASQKDDVVQSSSAPWHEDDENGHFNYRLGENLTSRYKILGLMGEGTFGRVLECWDRDGQEVVAIKVVRNVDKYREAAKNEVDILLTLAKKDAEGLGGCVQVRSWFDYRKHICIVCEKLGPSLFDFLRANNYSPFSIDLIQDFGRQILGSLTYLHSLKLIHTDLKPENILLTSSDYVEVVDYKNPTKYPSVQMKRVPKSSKIKLIDFGSATYDREDSFSVVSTRHYRAPEVILGLGWSFPCDIWSVGCILVELCSGEALFQTHENIEHLAMMERVLGPIPSHIIKRSMQQTDKYFKYGRELNWPDECTTSDSIQAVNKLPRLRNLIMQHADHSAGLLIDLLEKLLKYDPEERLTAREALLHPFFKEGSRRR